MSDPRPDERLDAALAQLGAPDPAPPPVGVQLRAALEDLAPAPPRRPRRELLVFAGASLLYALGLVLLLGLRGDLTDLATPWVLGYALAWAVSFAGIAWLAIVPARGQVLPRWRAAGIAALVAALVFVTGGLLLSYQAASSVTYEPTASSVIAHGHGCLRVGLGAAVVPVLIAALVLRRTCPVGSRWIAAAIGAAAGSLGGLVLHFHCPIVERFHLGLIHGGVVVLGALLCALILPRLIRP